MKYTVVLLLVLAGCDWISREQRNERCVSANCQLICSECSTCPKDMFKALNCTKCLDACRQEADER